jgi:hypothetical protein
MLDDNLSWCEVAGASNVSSNDPVECLARRKLASDFVGISNILATVRTFPFSIAYEHSRWSPSASINASTVSSTACLSHLIIEKQSLSSKEESARKETSVGDESTKRVKTKCSRLKTFTTRAIRLRQCWIVYFVRREYIEKSVKRFVFDPLTRNWTRQCWIVYFVRREYIEKSVKRFVFDPLTRNWTRQQFVMDYLLVDKLGYLIKINTAFKSSLQEIIQVFLNSHNLKIF